MCALSRDAFNPILVLKLLVPFLSVRSQRRLTVSGYCDGITCDLFAGLRSGEARPEHRPSHAVIAVPPNSCFQLREIHLSYP